MWCQKVGSSQPKKAISLLINEKVNQFLLQDEGGIPLVPGGCFPVQALSNWARDCCTKQHVLLQGPGFILPVPSKITATKGEFWPLNTLISLDGVLAFKGVQNGQWYAAKQITEIRRKKWADIYIAGSWAGTTEPLIISGGTILPTDLGHVTLVYISPLI